jgi:hypothetical protein
LDLEQLAEIKNRSSVVYYKLLGVAEMILNYKMDKKENSYLMEIQL